MTMVMDEKVKAKEAWRIVYPQFCETKIKDNSNNLQNIFTPYDLCYDMVRKLESYTGDLKCKTFCIFNLEFAEVLCYDFGVPLEWMLFVTDCKEKIKFAQLKRYTGLQTELMTTDEFLKGKWDMKFDVILGNPPYQAPKLKEHKGTGKCGKSIWEPFVEKSLELAKEDGYVCLIHPSRWRKPKSKIGEILKAKQIRYLEMHSFEDGKKTFGCTTDYDWYVLKNTQCNEKTTIKDQQGIVQKIRICKMPFIPNTQIKTVMNLVAKDGEETVELLWDCTYHTQARAKDGTMSREKTTIFKYPCVYSVKVSDIPTIWYSSKKEQFFDIPKVIWGNGHGGVCIDKLGKYGATQFASCIADKPENLNNIAKVLKSKQFLIDIMGHEGSNAYDKNIIATFRKDFWKDFI